ncbi:MAG: molecular chaperone HtpG [Bacteroidia bacterium]|nr:molecular chaperone HtpG [Bacteroidia bacterium]MDW8088325.1 molecular chaperone HtpG [Bacteroidia bacterium]
MRQGTLSVHLPGILPIIRKYLYTHSDVFLRELIANGVDACQKLLAIARSENLSIDPSTLKVEILAYPARRQLVVRDNGIGMTEEEVERFLAVIAASSAQEFAEKYKETDIIGFFGMGFYAAFMVAEKVEVLTQSYRSEAPGVRWVSTGTETYEIEPAQRPEGRGTTVTLHLHKDYDEYAQIWRIRQIAEKYARFLPVTIEVEGSPINKKPLWRAHPTQLSEKDYKEFYKLLYPQQPEPILYLHLNMDYPLHLQGILYFPPLRPDSVIERHTLALYVRGMFITDQLSEILPPYFELLHGVIESSDIPLNVSRSQLQVDPTVRKVSQYISRKVIERLKELLETDRARYEQLWPHIGPFVKYGTVREEDFAHRAKDLILVETVAGKHYTLSEYKAQIASVKSSAGYLVGFYANDLAKQGALARLFEEQGYLVVKADTVIDPYWFSYTEGRENIRWVRVDAQEAAEWLKSDRKEKSLTPEEVAEVKKALESLTQLRVEPQALGPSAPAALLVREELSRRAYEATLREGPPAPTRLIFNTSHPIYRRYLLSQDIRWLEHARDWAQLLSGELQAEQLRAFLERDWALLSAS